MKALLTTIALFEGGTGIALLLIPATIIPLLLGIPFDGPDLHIVGGITGAALITISIVCWLYRNSSAHAAPTVKAVLFYNISAGFVLLYAVLGLQLSGIGLWPATLLHFAFAIWCLVELRKKTQTG